MLSILVYWIISNSKFMCSTLELQLQALLYSSSFVAWHVLPFRSYAYPGVSIASSLVKYFKDDK